MSLQHTNNKKQKSWWGWGEPFVTTGEDDNRFLTLIFDNWRKRIKFLPYFTEQQLINVEGIKEF